MGKLADYFESKAEKEPTPAADKVKSAMSGPPVSAAVISDNQNTDLSFEEVKAGAEERKNSSINVY